jgi:uncharacterized membrane protein (TIGR02234 family)
VKSGRRELVAAVGLTLLGAVLTLFATGRTWAVAVVREPPLPTQTVHLSGRPVAPLAAALGIAGLAASVAVLASRGRWRVLVGALIALVGAGIVGTSASLSASEIRQGSALRERAPNAALRDAVVVVELRSWRHVAAGGGVCLVAAGLLTVARGRALATMGRRYDAPGAAPPEPAPEPAPQLASSTSEPVADADLWEQLERGEDPTA